MKWLHCFLSDINECVLQEVYAGLDISRKQYIDRIKAKNKRRQSLAGEWLIKKLLADGFNTPNPTVCRDENGRPYIKDSNIFISIAHSGNMIAVAADYIAVGIDVEKIKPNNLRLVDKICLPNEREYITASPNESLFRFYEVWTAKEAYFKKQGSGITDFKSVDTLNLNRHIFNIDGYLIQIVV